MREQLTQYVNLLFAGAPDTDDIKQEILQNTLDRYDDLIAQGKAPEAAYRLAISGIGDINEILGSTPKANSPVPASREPSPVDQEQEKQRKNLRAAGIAMYILSAIPLIAFSEMGASILGLCLTIALVGTATYLMIITSGKDRDDEVKPAKDNHPKSPEKSKIEKILDPIVLILFFILSFSTGGWSYTWLIFPLAGCIKGLIFAIMDLKEENENEI